MLYSGIDQFLGQRAMKVNMLKSEDPHKNWVCHGWSRCNGKPKMDIISILYILLNLLQQMFFQSVRLAWLTKKVFLIRSKGSFVFYGLTWVALTHVNSEKRGEVNQCFKKQCKEDKADIREQMGSQPTETKNNAKLCVFLEMIKQMVKLLLPAPATILH